MTRKGLAKVLRKYLTFVGYVKEVTQVAPRYGNPFPTILIKPVFLNGKSDTLTDHIWISYPNMAQDEPLPNVSVGDYIRFNGTVDYYQHYSHHLDITIMGIRNVSIIERPKYGKQYNKPECLTIGHFVKVMN